jgi:hypothetical protein
MDGVVWSWQLRGRHSDSPSKSCFNRWLSDVPSRARAGVGVGVHQVLALVGEGQEAGVILVSPEPVRADNRLSGCTLPLSKEGPSVRIGVTIQLSNHKRIE